MNTRSHDSVTPQAPAPHSPLADPSAVVQGPHYRFTVLTSRLIRMEWSPSNDFVDSTTPMVVNRRYDVPSFEVETSDQLLVIRTEHLVLRYDKKPFSPGGLTITLRHKAQGSHHTTWHFADPPMTFYYGEGNLRGTARTLDNVDGSCELEAGILATYGYAVVDDSTSVELLDDGGVHERPAGGTDLYFFGHGRDYNRALADFFALTGPVPLVPRRALGNWWSRYWAYNDTEYLELMARFARQGAPFSVAVLDMDWHLVDIPPELGSGWTGYTWNKGLFPDPPAFLAALHDQGMLIMLNLHPADGVRKHEDAYPAMATDLGLDPASGIEIAFDLTSPTFVDAYLKRLHHPLEDEGVDYWWIDWQSGGVTTIAGLDPLWMLNHIHYHDSANRGRRPLILSRYAGAGSHRYPIGFSGDAFTTWKSLDFQPYFTATAANVGYFWWSHDIGGHMLGVDDTELSVRWLQFGTLSPINRLHSANDPFNTKDPDSFEPTAREIMIAFLRLRHRLVPYLYTAAWQAHAEFRGVVRPMYHDYPNHLEALQVPNQYLLGKDVIVAPITTPMDQRTGLAGVTIWLPPGDWVDLFTGRQYSGGRYLTMHRTLHTIPVLVRAGVPLPLLDDPLQDLETNPDTLVLRITRGVGATTLYEDDGQSAPTLNDRQETKISVDWSQHTPTDVHLRIDAPSGPGSNHSRDLILDLVGATSIKGVHINGEEATADVESPSRVDGLLSSALRVRLGKQDLSQGLDVRLESVIVGVADRVQDAFTLLDHAQIEYRQKYLAMLAAQRLSGTHLFQELATLGLPATVIAGLMEVAG